MKRYSYDFIVVGQGLAGTVLAGFLINENKKVLIIDNFNSESSSQVAAGLFNPVTGRRVVKSWYADTLLPYSRDFYQKCESEWKATFYHPKDVLEFVYSIRDQNEWSNRMNEPEMKKYLSVENPGIDFGNIISPFNACFRITSSGWLNIPEFISCGKNYLENRCDFLKKKFDYFQLKINDYSVEYEEFHSHRIIFCEGNEAMNNPLWSWLPLVPAKGEILTIVCKGLPENFILMSGLFLIPLGNNHFRAGATFEWNYNDEFPSEDGKNKLKSLLDNFLLLPYEIVSHRAGIRPTVKDRRPLIGNHPQYKNVYIFNGLGTKGVQIAPYFANRLVKHFSEGIPMEKEVNISRYYQLYS